MSDKEIDPFGISLEELKKFSSNQCIELSNKVYELHKEQIEEISRKEAKEQFIVICDRGIILATNDESDVTTDKLKNLMVKEGLCYLYNINGSSMVG